MWVYFFILYEMLCDRRSGKVRKRSLLIFSRHKVLRLLVRSRSKIRRC
ncbi:hypothetical protein N0Y54_05430 [Nostoc punctiforme UO1]